MHVYLDFVVFRTDCDLSKLKIKSEFYNLFLGFEETRERLRFKPRLLELAQVRDTIITIVNF